MVTSSGVLSPRSALHSGAPPTTCAATAAEYRLVERRPRGGCGVDTARSVRSTAGTGGDGRAAHHRTYRTFCPGHVAVRGDFTRRTRNRRAEAGPFAELGAEHQPAETDMRQHPDGALFLGVTAHC